VENKGKFRRRGERGGTGKTFEPQSKKKKDIRQGERLAEGKKGRGESLEGPGKSQGVQEKKLEGESTYSECDVRGCHSGKKGKRKKR